MESADLALWLKSRIIASRFEGAANSVRRALSFRERISNPDLGEFFLESARIPFILHRLLKPTASVLDIGCHLGSFLSLAMKVAPAGSFVAVEPSLTKARWLRERFPNTLIIWGAISDQNGFSLFHEDRQNSGYSKLVSNGDASDCYKVKTRTLDDLPLGHVDFIKIDVEGAELSVLRGGRAFFEECRPPILFESGIEHEGTSLDRRELFCHLTDVMRYKVFTFTDFIHNKGPVSYDEFRKCGIFPFRALNYLALP